MSEPIDFREKVRRVAGWLYSMEHGWRRENLGTQVPLEDACAAFRMAAEMLEEALGEDVKPWYAKRETPPQNQPEH
jgi:hypothetical protein